MAFFPQIASHFEGIDLVLIPPRLFIARLMQLPMMPAAKRHGELITDFETDCPWLRKTQMMRI